MKPKISVIIPVYNRRESINISLDSLKNQKFDEFEVIIIDDGSTDGTSVIVNRFAQYDNRFKYFHQSNLGVAMARNAGIEKSEGEYICFLDSDDYFDPTYLIKMYEEITKKDSDICYCGYYLDVANSLERVKTKFINKNVLSNYIKGRIKVPTTGWLIKRNIITLNQIKFPIELLWGEDFYFFCILLASTSNISYVKDYLVFYRFNYSSEQLSFFSLDKIDKDYKMIRMLVNEDLINKSKITKRELVEYKLVALITYRLIKSISRNIDVNMINDYYNKYNKCINMSMNNGLRSLKLNFYIILLKYKIKTLNRRNK